MRRRRPQCSSTSYSSRSPRVIFLCRRDVSGKSSYFISQYLTIRLTALFSFQSSALRNCSLWSKVTRSGQLVCASSSAVLSSLGIPSRNSSKASTLASFTFLTYSFAIDLIVSSASGSSDKARDRSKNFKYSILVGFRKQSSSKAAWPKILSRCSQYLAMRAAPSLASNSPSSSPHADRFANSTLCAELVNRRGLCRIAIRTDSFRSSGSRPISRSRSAMRYSFLSRSGGSLPCTSA
mmetsp:Transcript_3073/g.8017  ORF Transcript_3073/g.8017 Transcript_3073/m.8017 type:complete len:237 (-) Transcript_3073:505-1215(-)